MIDFRTQFPTRDAFTSSSEFDLINFRSVGLCQSQFLYLSSFTKFALNGISSFTKEFFFQKECLKIHKHLMSIQKVEKIFLK